MYRKTLHTLIACLLLAAGLCPTLQAQTDSSRLTLGAYALYDFHYATGSIGGGAVMVDWRVADHYSLGGGLEYASSSRIAVRLEGRARLMQTAKGWRLQLENSYLWRQFPQLDMQEFTGALQLGWYARHVRLHLGLCNRYTANIIQRANDGAETLFEPMNVMFAAEAWLFDGRTDAARPWDVALRWSNYNDFIIERVALWFYSAKGHYRLRQRLDLTAEVGFHPVGSLNLTSSYDGWFAHLGARINL